MELWILLSCHVYKGIYYHYNHNQVSIGLLYSAFPPNCYYVLSHNSQSHGSPKIIFTRLEEKDPNTILRKIKIFVFEIAKVKVQ